MLNWNAQHDELNVAELADDITIADLKEITKSCIADHCANNPSLTRFLCHIVDYVLDNQCVQWRQSYWLAIQGICTSLAAGVQLANLYLASTDNSVVTQHRPRLYKRLVDDSGLRCEGRGKKGWSEGDQHSGLGCEGRVRKGSHVG